MKSETRAFILGISGALLVVGMIDFYIGLTLTGFLQLLAATIGGIVVIWKQ